MRRVVCAAIRAEDGHVVIGISIIAVICTLNPRAKTTVKNLSAYMAIVKAFVIRKASTLTRKEAFMVAEEACQIANVETPVGKLMMNGSLYSEGLY